MYDYANGMPLLHVQTEKQDVSHLFTIKRNFKKLWHSRQMDEVGEYNAK